MLQRLSPKLWIIETNLKLETLVKWRVVFGYGNCFTRGCIRIKIWNLIFIWSIVSYHLYLEKYYLAFKKDYRKSPMSMTCIFSELSQVKNFSICRQMLRGYLKSEKTVMHFKWRSFIQAPSFDSYIWLL